MKWAIMRIQVENAKYRRQCPVCNVNYTYNPAGKDKGREHKRGLFCSQDCRHADVVARREAKEAEPKPMKPPRILECATCKTAFAAYGAQKYCGAACIPACASAVHAQTLKCRECGDAYVQETYNGRPGVYCSEVCRKTVARRTRRIQGSKRKALVRKVSIENVDPINVFEHDHWTCMICVNPTPKEKRGTHDHDAPELDHIVPLAKGGAHSYANTQTLCRSCNMKKSDTLVPSLRDLL